MSKSTPTINCKARIGMAPSRGRGAAPWSASAAGASAAPVSAGRQPRASPTASTIVSASTASTNDAASDPPAADTLVVRFVIAEPLAACAAGRASPSIRPSGQRKPEAAADEDGSGKPAEQLCALGLHEPCAAHAGGDRPGAVGD